MPRWRVQCTRCGQYLGRWPRHMEKQARRAAREHRKRWHDKD